MQYRYLLLNSGTRDRFWEWIIDTSRSPYSHNIIPADSVTGALMESLSAIRAVVIPLMPASPRLRYAGFERFLEFKHLEHEMHGRLLIPSHVIPTIFCSFLPDEQFCRCLEIRFGAKLGRFLGLLCTSHERMPFDSGTLLRSLATAEEKAQDTELIPYGTAINITISDHSAHAQKSTGHVKTPRRDRQ